jgi:hypothetical protein
VEIELFDLSKEERERHTFFRIHPMLYGQVCSYCPMAARICIDITILREHLIDSKEFDVHYFMIA